MTATFVVNLVARSWRYWYYKLASLSLGRLGTAQPPRPGVHCLQIEQTTLGTSDDLTHESGEQRSCDDLNATQYAGLAHQLAPKCIIEMKRALQYSTWIQTARKPSLTT